jgi:uncharacterized protein
MENMQMNLNSVEKAIKWLVIFLGILSLFFVLKGVTLLKEYKFIGSGTTATNTISVSGEGEVFAVPDIAHIRFTVESDKKTVKEAQAEVNKKINEAIVYLKSAGVEEKDIKTENYSSYPKYEWQEAKVSCLAIGCPPPTPGKQVQVGFQVSQSIHVKVRLADNAGEIIDGLGKIGVTNISGPEFAVDDDSVIKDQARAKAIEDAKEKAETLAKQLGVQLIRIVSFSDNSSGGYPAMYRADMAYGSAESANLKTTLPKGENTFAANVTLVYEIR